jgi:hypothetical protein
MWLTEVEPAPVKGPVTSCSGFSPVRVRGEKLHDVWHQGCQWAVTAYGLECRDGTYAIERTRLLENKSHSWIAHVGEKEWVHVDDFASVFFVALALHGYKLTRKQREMMLRDVERARADEKRYHFTLDGDEVIYGPASTRRSRND